MSTLGDEFPVELKRCRELLGQYEKLGPVGGFGALMIRGAIKRAEEAERAQDVVAMLRAFREMKGCK